MDDLTLPAEVMGAIGTTTPERSRLRVAMRLQEIEGNPLSADQIAMFEMFEREGWTHERRLAHLLARARQKASA